MTTKPARTLTELERVVVERVKKNEDPWQGRHGVGSRSVSGALSRLTFKGYICEQYSEVTRRREYKVTKEGLEALEGKKT